MLNTARHSLQAVSKEIAWHPSHPCAAALLLLLLLSLQLLPLLLLSLLLLLLLFDAQLSTGMSVTHFLYSRKCSRYGIAAMPLDLLLTGPTSRCCTDNLSHWQPSSTQPLNDFGQAVWQCRTWRSMQKMLLESMCPHRPARSSMGCGSTPPKTLA